MLPFSKRSNRSKDFAETFVTGEVDPVTSPLHRTVETEEESGQRPVLITLNDALEEVEEQVTTSATRSAMPSGQFDDEEATCVFESPKAVKSTFLPLGPSMHRVDDGQFEALRRNARPAMTMTSPDTAFVPAHVQAQVVARMDPSHVSIADHEFESVADPIAPPPESAAFEAPATVVGASEPPSAASLPTELAPKSRRGRPTASWALGLVAAGVLFGVGTVAVARGDAGRLLARVHGHSAQPAIAAAAAAPQAPVVTPVAITTQEPVAVLRNTRPIPLTDVLPSNNAPVDTSTTSTQTDVAPAEAPKVDAKIVKATDAPKIVAPVKAARAVEPAPVKVAAEAPKPAPKAAAAPKAVTPKKAGDDDMDSAARALAKAQLEQSL